MKAATLRAFGLLIALAITTASVGALSAHGPSQEVSQGAPQTTRSPCDVLTKQEVEAVLGAKVGEPVQRADACHFQPAGRPARGIIVTVYWTGGERRMDATRMAEQMFRSSGTLQKELGHSNDDVKDLGDDASFPLKTLNVLKGDAFLKIDADQCSREQAIALARKALSRL